MHANSLQIMFYFNELEVANPLGSKAKIHKVKNVASFRVAATIFSLTWQYNCRISKSVKWRRDGIWYRGLSFDIMYLNSGFSTVDIGTESLAMW